MSKMCDGMSGREISKLGVAWQAAVYSSETGILTEKMVMDRCDSAVYQHKQKVRNICLFSLMENQLLKLYIFYLIFFRWHGCRNKKK